MKRITQSLLTQYRREIATSCAVIASLLLVERLAPIGSHDVAIAIHDLPAGTQISASDLGVAKSGSWPNEIRNRDELIGKTLNHAIPAGAMITSSDLVGTALPDDGRVQVGIPLTQPDSKILTSGMHIDIYSPNGLVAADAVVISITSDQKSGLLSSGSSASALIALVPTEVPALAVAREQTTLTIAIRPSN